MEELDNEPTVKELSKAMDSLASGKAPGNDAMPPGVIRHGKRAQLLHLHELLCLCWKEERFLGTCPMRGRPCTKTKVIVVIPLEQRRLEADLCKVYKYLRA